MRHAARATPHGHAARRAPPARQAAEVLDLVQETLGDVFLDVADVAPPCTGSRPRRRAPTSARCATSCMPRSLPAAARRHRHGVRARSPRGRAALARVVAQRAARRARFLDASLDPADPDFYDYERAEWFTTPRDTGERWIAGPFLDHSGTNEHILTLTLPVVRDGAFLGVAGADIAVGAIEAIGGAALRRSTARLRSSTIVAGSSRRNPAAACRTLWPGAEDAWPPRGDDLLFRDLWLRSASWSRAYAVGRGPRSLALPASAGPAGAGTCPIPDDARRPAAPGGRGAR